MQRKFLAMTGVFEVTSKMRELLKKDANPVDQVIYDYTSRVSAAK